MSLVRKFAMAGVAALPLATGACSNLSPAENALLFGGAAAAGAAIISNENNNRAYQHGNWGRGGHFGGHPPIILGPGHGHHGSTGWCGNRPCPPPGIPYSRPWYGW